MKLYLIFFNLISMLYRNVNSELHFSAYFSSLSHRHGGSTKTIERIVHTNILNEEMHLHCEISEKLHKFPQDF